MPEVVVHAHWAATITELASPLAELLPETAGRLPIIPSPIRRGTAEISELRQAWRQLGNRTSLQLPRSTASTILPGRGPSPWTAIDVRGMQLRLDSRLTAGPYVVVLVLNERLQRGPFALEIPMHFVHPVDRICLAMNPDRGLLHADVFACVQPDLILAITPIAGGWLTVASTDAVAAELWSLGLAEQWLPPDVELQGPWEDPSLQRATQLEVGIQVPTEMALATDSILALPAEARDLLLETATRLGMPVPPRSG